MDKPDGASTRGRRVRRGAIAVALGSLIFAVGAVGFSPIGSAPADSAPIDSAPVAGRNGSGQTPHAASSAAALRKRVRQVPQDADAWSALGMTYVQQARVTTDPATYAAAESALRRSLRIQPYGNDRAETAMGALAAGRHEFQQALRWARKATDTNRFSASAHGVLADAYTQLGRYENAFQTVQRMVDLRPDSASLARASYTWELRGDTRRARDLMTRSLRAAHSDSERSFAHTHLALLAVDSGDARTALRHANSGLRRAPQDTALLEARARAHHALGQPHRAAADYRAAIAIAPLPHYLLGLGELQQSLGQHRQAQDQYAVLRAQDELRRAGQAAPDVDAILFEAEHGDADKARRMAEQAVATRPFIAVHDAYAWALHRTGRNTEALTQANRSLALGTRSALFHFHRGVIHQELGDDTAARKDLERALLIDPHFHPLHAGRARTELGRIDADR